MMRPEVHWIDLPAGVRSAIMPRPRGRAMPRGWRLSYYGRIADTGGSPPAPEHAGGVSFQVSPCDTRPSGFGAKDEPNSPKSSSAGILPFCFRIDKIHDSSA
jgi:hypothetical protein